MPFLFHNNGNFFLKNNICDILLHRPLVKGKSALSMQSKPSASKRRLRGQLALALRREAGCTGVSHASHHGDLADELAPIGMECDPRKLAERAIAVRIAVAASRGRESENREPRRRQANCRRREFFPPATR
jgi:hypothetical protein